MWSKARRFGPTTRVAISVIALYALLLQACIAAAAPAFSSDPSADLRCATGKPREDSPGGTHSDQHCLCCILACVACGVASLAGGVGLVFPLPLGSIVTFALVEATGLRTPSRFYFAARGPPAGL